jgi:hypothetical protein
MPIMLKVYIVLFAIPTILLLAHLFLDFILTRFFPTNKRTKKSQVLKSANELHWEKMKNDNRDRFKNIDILG